MEQIAETNVSTKKFSIIVVCLNPGEKLNLTLDSVLNQTFQDYEILVKDGGSRDGSVEGMRQDERIRLFREKDSSIYEAMNQAVSHAEGQFLLFLNCGDFFAGETVLEKTAAFLEKEESKGSDLTRLVLYGDIFSEKTGAAIAAAPRITGFTCYRNIPCHQACFYSRQLCLEKPYEVKYRIRADYDHFLWCFYKGKATFLNMGFAVASYEGGGYSESKENQKRDEQEHQEITASYMGKAELFQYRLLLFCTFAPLRRAMAESKVFSGLYQRLKSCFYTKR